MKKTIILIAAIFITTYCSAQDSINYFTKRNEINIGYFNILTLGYSNTFGIGYKIRIKNSAIRFRCAFNYSKNTQNFSNQNSKYSSTGVIPEIGYEYRLNFKRSMVFYGLDLCGSYDKAENISSSSSSYKSEEIGYGVSPFIGYKFFINKNISISTETSFDFLLKKENSETTNFNGSSYYTTLSDNETLSARLSPLGILSINIHF